MVGRATFCSILKVSFDLIRWYIVLYFLPKKSILPTNGKIKGLIGSQNGANIHSSVLTSLQYPTIKLYTSVVDFIHFRRLVESALKLDIKRTSVINPGGSGSDTEAVSHSQKGLFRPEYLHTHWKIKRVARLSYLIIDLVSF